MQQRPIVLSIAATLMAQAALDDPPVSIDYLAGATLSVLLVIYLAYALLRPERF